MIKNLCLQYDEILPQSDSKQLCLLTLAQWLHLKSRTSNTEPIYSCPVTQLLKRLKCQAWRLNNTEIIFSATMDLQIGLVPCPINHYIQSGSYPLKFQFERLMSSNSIFLRWWKTSQMLTLYKWNSINCLRILFLDPMQAQ